MSWDEWIFRKLWHRFVQNETPVGQYRVDDSLRRWQGFCSLIASRPLRVRTTEDLPGRSSTTVYLPHTVQLFTEYSLNEKALLLKAFLLSAAYPHPHSSEQLQKFCQDQPSFGTAYTTLLNALPADDEERHNLEQWMLLHSERHDNESNANDTTDSSKDERPDTQMEIDAANDVTIQQVDRKAIQDYTLNHSFEKIDTIEEFNGNWRELDDSDELEDHREAIEELKLRDLVRVDEQARSMLQANLRLDLMTGESKSTTTGRRICIPYREWDAKRRLYKSEWCHVYPAHFTRSNPGYYASILEEHASALIRLKRKFRFLRNDRETVKHMADGAEIDLESAILWHVDRRAGLSPDSRVYQSSRKSRRDISVLILLDHSLSTDSYTNGHHILSLACKAITLTSAVFAEAKTRFQIDAFYSHTRNQIEYSTVKAFHEPWPQCADRLGAIQASGYTRIGPAVRHATALLEEDRSRHRWILLLSDARPNDYDRYEGRYGIADVKQAIREARSKGIHLHAFSLDSQARHYLPEMFGAGGFSLIQQPEKMVDVLTDFYLKLARR